MLVHPDIVRKLTRALCAFLWMRSKACIDQANIDASLAGLPVYVSGCQTLLVLCGETYLSRLWCCLELFTFLVMGAEKERVEVNRISNAPELSEGLVKFRSADAQCYKEEDRQRMLGVVESAYGTLEAFDEAVVRVLLNATVVESERCERALSRRRTERKLNSRKRISFPVLSTRRSKPRNQVKVADSPVSMSRLQIPLRTAPSTLSVHEVAPMPP